MPKALETLVTSVALYGPTGQQLFLADGEGDECLLYQMTHDSKLPFMAALRAFQSRVLYGNTCNDFLVK